MSDNRRYFYLKLNENFFDSEDIVLLESMPDGIAYSNILLKLYLKSLKNEGKLLYNDVIPYSSQMIAAITRMSVGMVEKALKIFADMGIIEILDDGAIYMMKIQNFIGETSTEADRKRNYRKRIEQEKGQMSIELKDKCSDNRPQSIEIRDKSKRQSKSNSKNNTSFDFVEYLKEKRFYSEDLERAILDWLEMRKKTKSAPTDRAIRMSLDKAIDDSNHQIDVAVEMFDRSTMNNWKGVFKIPEKELRGPYTKRSQEQLEPARYDNDPNILSVDVDETDEEILKKLEEL